MRKFYQTPEFRSLEQEWEQKLSASGFEDIEKRCGSNRELKLYSISFARWKRDDPQEAAIKRDYHQALQEQVSQAHFDSALDREVMMMKSEGARISEICKALLKEGILKYRGTIRLIIRKYEHRWGIRNWKPELMDYNLKNKKPTRSSPIWGPNFQIFIGT